MWAAPIVYGEFESGAAVEHVEREWMAGAE